MIFCTHNRNDHKAYQEQAASSVERTYGVTSSTPRKVRIPPPYSTLSLTNHSTTMTIKKCLPSSVPTVLWVQLSSPLSIIPPTSLSPSSHAKPPSRNMQTNKIVKYVSDDPTPDELVGVLQGSRTPLSLRSWARTTCTRPSWRTHAWSQV